MAGKVGKALLISSVIVAGVGAVIAYKEREKIASFCKEFFRKANDEEFDLENMPVEPEMEAEPEMVIYDHVTEPELNNNAPEGVEDDAD